MDTRETLGRGDDAVDPSGLVEDLDAHRRGCVEAASGIDAQAAHTGTRGVVGQVQVEVGLFERGDSIAAYLETGDELASTIGDEQQGLVGREAEGGRCFKIRDWVMASSSAGILVNQSTLGGIQAVGVPVGPGR